MEKIEFEDFIATNFGNVDLSGFQYLVEACSLYPDKVTNIYKIVSKKFDTTPSRVERNIRHYISKIHDFTCLNIKINETISNLNFIASIYAELNIQNQKRKTSIEFYHILSDLEMLKAEIKEIKRRIP